MWQSRDSQLFLYSYLHRIFYLCRLHFYLQQHGEVRRRRPWTPPFAHRISTASTEDNWTSRFSGTTTRVKYLANMLDCILLLSYTRTVQDNLSWWPLHNQDSYERTLWILSSVLKNTSFRQSSVPYVHTYTSFRQSSIPIRFPSIYVHTYIRGGTSLLFLTTTFARSWT